MPAITFVTHNRGKLASLRRQLLPYGINVEHHLAELVEIQADTTAAVAYQKVIDAHHLTGQPTIALDAGLSLDERGGFPGPYTEYVIRSLGIPGIAETVSDGSRCHFVNSLAFFNGQGVPTIFEGKSWGHTSLHPFGQVRPDHWSPLSTIFVPDGWQKTMAEMTVAEIDTWRLARDQEDSYLQLFASWLLSYLT